VWLFAGSVPELAGGAVFNTAPVYGPDGELRAAHRKAHLYTALGEDLVFTAGDEVTVVDAGPLGQVGVSICFDGDHFGYSRALRSRGARVVVSMSAYEVAAERWWDLLHPAQALAHGQWWLMANQCGGTGPTALLGRSRVIAPDGDVVAEAPRVGSDDGPHHLVVDLDPAAGIDQWDRTSSLLWSAAREETYAVPRG
jgi:predicted amidohydrolase